jgi:cyclic pyranopterin phosphate synthase
MAETLHNAGLNRVNVSLCSLKPDIFKRISGSDSLDKVLIGLDKAKEVGFFPIKLNFVLLKGINTNEIDDMIEFCSKTGFILQIIELHPVLNHMGNGKKFYDMYHFDLDPLIKDLESKALNTIKRTEMQNRKVFLMPKSIIIETVKPEHNFCLGCSKLRIGCNGNIFGCLYHSDLGINIKNALNNNHSLLEYETILKEVMDTRKPYY